MKQIATASNRAGGTAVGHSRGQQGQQRRQQQQGQQQQQQQGQQGSRDSSNSSSSRGQQQQQGQQGQQQQQQQQNSCFLSCARVVHGALFWTRPGETLTRPANIDKKFDPTRPRPNQPQPPYVLCFSSTFKLLTKNYIQLLHDF